MPASQGNWNSSQKTAPSSTVSGTVNSGTFTGNGSGLTSLNASNLSSGTVPVTALIGTYNINISGNAATATNAT